MKKLEHREGQNKTMTTRSKTDWFKDLKWGVFVHFLAAEAGTKGGKEISAEQWNQQVDAFNVHGLAEQLRKVEAKYIFITVGQNSGHFCAPNATYDRYVDINPSKCSRRDLVLDLYDALHLHGIELLVYLPSSAPAADPVAVKRLGWEWGFKGGWPHGWGTKRTGKRLAGFQDKWESITREWSNRWGRKVRGWWVDGCYFADEMYRHKDHPNFRSFAAAMKAGNPNAIVAFNSGVKVPVISMTKYEDYTAGEINTAFPVGDKYQPPLARRVDGAQYHVLSFLGDGWGVGQPRFPKEFVVGFTKYTNAFQGVVSWDVPTKNGLIPQPFMDQLAAIGRATR